MNGRGTTNKGTNILLICQSRERARLAGNNGNTTIACRGNQIQGTINQGARIIKLVIIVFALFGFGILGTTSSQNSVRHLCLDKQVKSDGKGGIIAHTNIKVAQSVTSRARLNRDRIGARRPSTPNKIVGIGCFCCCRNVD